MTADERRGLKLLVDRKLREGGVAEPDPTRRGFGTGAGRKALLTEDDVLRAHRMAQVIPMTDVARLLWNHYGYASDESCKTALRRAFAARGLTCGIDGRTTRWEVAA